MSDYPAIPKPTVNFNDYLKMINNPDGSVTRPIINPNGSVTRPIILPTTAASPDHTTRIPVLSKDVTINPDKNIWVRIFLPREARDTSPPAAGAARKLPLIVYFHGGGFVICSAADTVFHDHCAHMAAEISAVVVSVEYRLVGTSFVCLALISRTTELCHTGASQSEWAGPEWPPQDSNSSPSLKDVKVALLLLSADGTRRATSTSLRLGLEFESWGGHSGPAHSDCDSPVWHSSVVRLTRAKQTNDIPTRLAPEHRLPAAYEDGVEALHFKSSGEVWVSEYADVSRCFLMGSSAGANLAYFTGIRVADSVGDLEPLKIRGLILHHPFFGGIQRTGSEVRLEKNGVLPLCATDLAWQLSLPEGVDRDHEYSNPMAKKASELCSKIGRVGWKLLVTGCEGDLLHDRQVEFVDMLKANGVEVEVESVRGDYHVIELFDSSKAKALFGLVKNFMA